MNRLLEHVFVQFLFDVFFEVFCFVLFRRMAKECAEATRQTQEHVDEGVVLGRLVVIFGHNAGELCSKVK